MNEADYWLHLEYRICRELSSIREFRQKGLWCDGLIPEQYDLTSDLPCIRGCVWICIGSREQQQWAFKFHLLHAVSTQEEIDWAKLLPAENMTGWLGVEPDDKCLDIEPGAAIRESF